MTTAENLQESFRYLFPDEVKALKELARSLPPNPVVCNLGAGAGTSSLAFLESRPDLFLYCIDIQKEDSPFGCLYAEAKVLDESGFSGRYTQIWGDSKETGKNWTEEFTLIRDNTWLVFIDADHSYNGCKGDILAWLPNIKPGGIMAVHDYDKKNVYKRADLPANVPHPLPWPGVDRAVRKFLCPKYEIVLHVDTLIAFEIK